MNATLDLPGGTYTGDWDVLATYTDGSGSRCVDLGRNGRRLCCGYVLDAVAAGRLAAEHATGLFVAAPVVVAAPISPGVEHVSNVLEGMGTLETYPTPERPFAERKTTIAGPVLVVDLMNVLVRCWHVGQPSDAHGVRGLLDSVRLIVERYQPSVIVFAAEGGHGHRHAIYPEYKATRPATDPNLKSQIGLCLRALEVIGWPVVSSAGFEADDVLATLATDLATRADRVVLVTSDKDLLGLVGRSNVTVYDPGKKLELTPELVVERLGVEPARVGDFLSLCGDSSDNIPGAAGIGAKTAATLLAVDSLTEIERAATQLDVIANSATPYCNRWRPHLKALTKVAASRESIELSRRLVTLHADLPLPTNWELAPALRPRAHWQQRLQELGLGAPAQRLASILGEPRDGERLDSDLLDAVEPQRCAASAGVLPAVGDDPGADSQTRPTTGHTLPPDADPVQSQLDSPSAGALPDSGGADVRGDRPVESVESVASAEPLGDHAEQLGGRGSSSSVEPVERVADRSDWPRIMGRVIELGCSIVGGPNPHGSYEARTPGGKSFTIYTGPLQHERRMVFGLANMMSLDELAAKIEASRYPRATATAANYPPVATFRTASRDALFG